MDSGLLSLIGIILGIALLIVLVYKGLNLTVSVIIALIVIALFSGMNPYTLISNEFISGFGTYATSTGLMFIGCTLFGAVLGASGAAAGIAKVLLKIVNLAPEKYRWFVAACVMTLINFILTYGGISGMVIIFTLLPIGKEMFEKLDMPWHLCMLMTYGSASAAIWLVGSPQIQNLLPMDILGTKATAGLGLSIIAIVLGTIFWALYAFYCVRKAKKEDEHFLPTGARIQQDPTFGEVELDDAPNFIVSLIPSIVLIVLLNVFELPIAVCCFVGIIVTIILFYKRMGMAGLKKSLADGITNCAAVVFGVCSCYGLGTAIQAVSGYEYVVNALYSLPGGSYFQFFIAITIMCGVTGSGQSGLSIGLSSLADHYLDLGLNANAMHRIGVIACSGLDTLPHNSSVVMCLNYSKLTYKEAYKHWLNITIIQPLIVCAICCVFASMGVV